ncbi:MAG: hypothetical protein AB1451_05880 [Nitrospirota bacterium]
MLVAERGAIAVLALAVLGVLSVLIGAWLRLVAGEREAVRLGENDLQARSLAQAGIDRTLAWFADPASFGDPFTIGATSTCGSAGTAAEVFRKRCVAGDGLPSFRAANGSPQFSGTVDSPAILVQWSDAPLLLRSPTVVGIDPGASRPAIRVEVQLSAPLSPDAVATVVSRASVGRATAAVRAELAEGPWRGAAQAVFAGPANTVPLRIHWGGVAITGGWDASEVLDRIPRRSDAAPVTGQAYAVEPGADRWVGFAASGSILGPSRTASGFAAPFEHLLQDAAIPRMAMWSYEALKTYARRHGRYFTTRGTGLVYPDDAETGISPTAAFSSRSGSGRLVFIDTLDRTPPRADNMEELRATMDFVEMDAYVGAHLTVTPGLGRSTVRDSPGAPEDPSGPPVTRNVAIAGVHYHGVLTIAGALDATARTTIVGSLAAMHGVRDPGAIEVWYDAALRTGYRTGFPPVVIKPGSRRAIVPD